MDEFLKSVDALVTPAAVGAAPDLSTTGDPVFNSPWSLSACPTVSFPIGSVGGRHATCRPVSRESVIRPASPANRRVVRNRDPIRESRELRFT